MAPPLARAGGAPDRAGQRDLVFSVKGWKRLTVRWRQRELTRALLDVRGDTAAAYRIVAADGAWDEYSRAWPEVTAYLDAQARPGTYCLPGVPLRLAVWFGDTRRIRAAAL
jgi:hypothetical protein